MDETEARHRFPLLDRYTGIRLGADLSALEPGRLCVVEAERRLRPEQSYGFIHALWWWLLADGRTVVSVPPGANKGVARIAEDLRPVDDAADPQTLWGLRNCVDGVLAGHGIEKTDRVMQEVCFACNAALLRRHHQGDCRRLVDDSLPAAEGLEVPTESLRRGIAYGVAADEMVVSIAHDHRTGLMEDQLLDLSVPGTAPAYRRRGYAKTAVSALVEHFTNRGGEARWSTTLDRYPAMATARSVGFVPYGKALILAAPSPD